MSNLYGLSLIDRDEEGNIRGGYNSINLFESQEAAHKYVPTFLQKTIEENEELQFFSLAPRDVVCQEYQIKTG